jgi:hypothetical protein
MEAMRTKLSLPFLRDTARKPTFRPFMNVHAFFARINAGTMLTVQHRPWGVTIAARVAVKKNTKNVVVKLTATPAVLPLML